MNKIVRYKLSLFYNCLIFILTVISTIIMFTGYKFMHGVEPILETTKLGVFKYFTVDSNIFATIISFFFICVYIRLLKGKIEDIPKRLYILKFMATVGVTLTFSVVFLYLGPISKGGISKLLQNSNLFFHLVIPLLNIIDFIFFIKIDNVKYKYAFYGLIPMLLYGCFYMTNILLHIEYGKISTKYDWYWFVQNGLWTMAIVIPIIIIFTYLLSLILIVLNKKILIDTKG